MLDSVGVCQLVLRVNQLVYMHLNLKKGVLLYGWGVFAWAVCHLKKQSDALAAKK